MVGRQDRARSGAFAVAARSGSRQTLKLTWRLFIVFFAILILSSLAVGQPLRGQSNLTNKG